MVIPSAKNIIPRTNRKMPQIPMINLKIEPSRFLALLNRNRGFPNFCRTELLGRRLM